MASLVPLSAPWWADRLYRKLRLRRPQIELYDAYYAGAHPLPDVPPQLIDEVRRFLNMCRSNYMRLVIEATLERLTVMGFRVGDSAEGDDAAWAIWQANNLDVWHKQGMAEAMKSGRGYLLAGPSPEAGAPPLLTVESPLQCIIECAPGSVTDRDAALKVWLDDRINRTMATLYMPDRIYKWEGRRGSAPSSWEPRQVDGEDGQVEGGAWVIENPLGVVPMLELPNRPQLSCGGVSELADVTPIQDRINLTLVDRLVTQAFGAFPQRYASNWPAGQDELVKQSDGSVKFQPAPLDIGRSRLIRFFGDARPGSFDVAPLDPYMEAKVADVKDIASICRIPAQYLLGDLINISAEGMDSAESGLTSKAEQQQIVFGDPFEEWIRLGLRLAGDPRGEDLATHTIWADARYRSLAQLTDAVIKQYAAGLITLTVAQEKLGYSPQEINRMASELRARQLLEQATASLFGAPAPAAAAAAS